MGPPETDEHLPSTAAPDGAGVTTTSRPRRTTDYRLRGLDLDAQALAEAPIRPARKSRRSRRARRRLVIQWLLVLTVTVTAAVLVRAYVFQSFSVSSASMVPTLQVGTRILVTKPTRLSGSIKTGDIVVFRAPSGFTCGTGGDNSHHLVSRVIGLPGQTIWSKGGRIYVDGHRLHEPGWYNPPFGELGGTAIKRTTIPAGRYFVAGDNRTDSCDSRSFGPIRRSLLVGKAVVSLSRNGHMFLHTI